MKNICKAVILLCFGLSIASCSFFLREGADWRPIVWGFNAGWTLIAFWSID